MIANLCSCAQFTSATKPSRLLSKQDGRCGLWTWSSNVIFFICLIHFVLDACLKIKVHMTVWGESSCSRSKDDIIFTSCKLSVGIDYIGLLTIWHGQIEYHNIVVCKVPWGVHMSVSRLLFIANTKWPFQHWVCIWHFFTEIYSPYFQPFYT